MPDPQLHQYTVAGADARRWLYVLHGIYGSGRNWASLARRLTGARPEWGAVLVDLRLHGHSRGLEPPHSLAACVHDLLELSASLDRPMGAVLGHSFGGKLALMLAASVRPRIAWVIDSSPSRRSPGGAAVRLLETLRRMPGPFAARADAIAAVEAEGYASNVARWLATNLALGDDGYRWRLDPEQIEPMLADYFRHDLWDVIESSELPSEIHVVRATKADVLTSGDTRRLRAAAARQPRIHAHDLDGGHWLHVGNPDGLLALLVKHLP